MGIKLAKNLIEAITKEWFSIDGPDPSYSFVARAKGLAEKLIIENMFFTQSLWWGVRYHRLNEVLNYFEKKYWEAKPSSYRVVKEDYTYFINLPAEKEEEL